MSKSLKIFLAVLALISVGFSLAFYFEWGLFAKKAETSPKEQPALIKTLDEVIRKIAKKPLPTPTPSKIETQPPCVVLDEPLCNQGKLIYDQNNSLVGLGFKLPKGTKIYAPFKGKMESTDTKVQIEGILYRASVLLDITKDDWASQQVRSIFAVLGYQQLAEADKDTFAKGEIFVLTRDSLVDPNLGDYNLILSFRTFDLEDNRWNTDIILSRQFFPTTQK